MLEDINSNWKYTFSRMIKSEIKKRKQVKKTQVEQAKEKGISLSSVIKVEKGKCYDLRIIDKYLK